LHPKRIDKRQTRPKCGDSCNFLPVLPIFHLWIANRDNENEEFTSIILYQEDDDSDCFDEMHKKHPIDDTNFYTLSDTLYSALELTENQELYEALVQLDEDLPQGIYEHWDEYYQWYKNNSNAWAIRLKELNRKYRNLDYNWQLGNDQNWGMLRAYCYANKLGVA
jgi:hypothetical protein